MKLENAVNIEDLHRMAKRRLPKIAFDFIEGGVEDELGISRNEAAFRRYRLMPRADRWRPLRGRGAGLCSLGN